jgi:hypothetical protein
MLQIKLKLCGRLTVAVNVFKCLHFNIIAFTSQTYHVICRYFCLRRCDKGDHMRHVMCDSRPAPFFITIYTSQCYTLLNHAEALAYTF